MDEGGGVVGRAAPMPLVHAIVNNMCGLATNLLINQRYAEVHKILFTSSPVSMIIDDFGTKLVWSLIV